ncbi:XRE family transcriptional regulator [Kitasatospora sp. Ki12]
MGENALLRQRMEELGLTQAGLARLMNAEIHRLTGRPGTISERTVYNLLAGVHRRPHGRTVAALGAVFGCAAADLGLVPPATHRSASPEASVDRRTFFVSGAAAAGNALVPALRQPASVGVSDVARARAGLAALDALDDHRGGHTGLERSALAGAARTLGLQKGSASERVRSRLFAVAADYTAVAAWSAIDARGRERAKRHLDRCLTLAGLARDPVAQVRVWNSVAMLAHQRGRHAEALAAAKAAQATGAGRRDPLFASLTHARAAVAHSGLGERRAAQRSLGHARDALARAEDRTTPRPSWVAFYGRAELWALHSIVHLQLSEPQLAEAFSHQALAQLPDRFTRNRAMATARLGLAQLGQGDAEQAAATGSTVFALMADAPLPGRMRTLLGDLHRGLLTLAPASPAAREWADRHRDDWSRP